MRHPFSIYRLNISLVPIFNGCEDMQLHRPLAIRTYMANKETSGKTSTVLRHRDVNMAQASSPESPSKLEFEDDFMHYYVVDGVRLPPFCRGKIQDIIEFPVRPDDVWILSYPRAGVWVQDLIYLLLQGGNLQETSISLETVEDAIPFLEGPSPGLETIKDLPSPRYIKSHLPFQLLPQGVQEKQCKVIYIARNPKDVMCSFYDFHRTVRMVHYKGTFNQFFYRFVNNKLGYGSYFDHVLTFWKNRHHENVLFLKYEDVKKDFPAAVIQVANFLDKPLGERAIKAINNYWDDEPLYNRKEDRVGFWRYYFTVHMNDKMNKLLPDKLKDADMEFDYTI
ncbi:sulfotransferase 4A1-like [Lytechinus variegatus]|uniref:sulfotransferase 4A1-like n=1 Tax=Lytechinus variegatus TaxID=7654 RepID=UPI001BB11CF9|nr:sulfotransferase 4A1-like [Lytechinus variegatus]